MTSWHLFATYTTNLPQLVKQTTLQELVAQLMNLSMDSEECVVSSNAYQINRVNTASRYMFWLIAKLSAWFLPKFTRQLALMHRIASRNPSCSGFGSVSVGNNQKHTIDNYYTSIPLVMELKSRKLTLVGTMKKNKACIPPSFLAKADEGTVQYAFDHENNFTLLSVAPKKNKRVVFLSTVHSEKKREARIPEKKK